MIANPLNDILNQTPEWRDRADRTPIPVERWGRDHWSLLLYVETRATDYRGKLDWNHLTLSKRNWPMLYAARNAYETGGFEDAADRYGLRLKSQADPVVGEVVFGCCEGDALMDLADAGLVTVQMPVVSSTGRSYLRPDGIALSSPTPMEPVTGLVELKLMPWARFGLTDKGWRVAGALRRFMADDKMWGEFEMSAEEGA